MTIIGHLTRAADPRLDRILKLLVYRSFPRLRRLPLAIGVGGVAAADELLGFTRRSLAATASA